MIKVKVLPKCFGFIGICFVFLMCAGHSCLYAGDFGRLDSEGLEGQKILSISSEGADHRALWIGTERGVFRRDLSKSGPWQKIILADTAEAGVHRIEFSPYSSFGYAATSKGVYEIDPVSLTAKKIYGSNEDSENDCSSVAVDAGQNIYVATKAGLFSRHRKAERWTKSVTALGDKAIDYVYAAGKAVYAAVSDGLYRSMDGAKTWNKVFMLSTESEEAPDDESEPNEENETNRIYAVVGEKGTSSTVYLGTSIGAFRSQDDGQSWEPLPQVGLDSKNILDLVLSISPSAVYAVSKNGVFQLNKDGWSMIAPLYGSRGMALVDRKPFVIATSGIYVFEMPNGRDGGEAKPQNDVPDLKKEPTIREVQQMVIEYCDVSNQKIDSWHKQARTKALLPDISFGYGNNVYGSYNGIFAVGPNDWQVNVSWDLADLIYSADQTSIDVRSRLMVQLRNDVLAEATQLYFERKRLRIELSDGHLSPQDLSKKQIRVEEISALLDRLTGGAFSKVLKSSP